MKRRRHIVGRTHPGVRCGLRVAAILCALLLGTALVEAAENASLEYPIKATFLQKFADFVTWPGSEERRDGPFAVCVYGEDPFGKVIDDAIKGRTVDRRSMTVQRVDTPERAAACQILYLGKTARPAQEILESLRGRPILTVTDSNTAPNARGIVHFVIDQNRVRFAIDNAAAEANHLNISAKLLAVAVAVNPPMSGGTR